MADEVFTPEELSALATEKGKEYAPKGTPPIEQKPIETGGIVTPPAVPAGQKPVVPDEFQLPPDIEIGARKTDEPVKPAVSAEPELTAAAIDVNSFPEKMRPNVGAMRKKLESHEATLKELETAGVKIERGADGKLKVILPKADGDIETLRKELDDRDAAIGKLSLVESPGFKSKYLKPIQDGIVGIFHTAVGLVGDQLATEDDKKNLLVQIQQLAGLPPSQRAAELHRRFPDYAGTFLPMFMQIDQLANQRNQAVNEWQETKRTMQEQEQNYVHAKTKEVKGRLRDEAIAEATQNGYFMFKKSTGTDSASQAWNTRVDAINSAVGTFFEDPDPVVASQAFVRAAASEYLLGLTQAQDRRIKELSQKLKAYGHTEAAISPKGGDGNRERNPSAAMTPDAAVADIMARLAG